MVSVRPQYYCPRASSHAAPPTNVGPQWISGAHACAWNSTLIERFQPRTYTPRRGFFQRRDARVLETSAARTPRNSRQNASNASCSCSGRISMGARVMRCWRRAACESVERRVVEGRVWKQTRPPAGRRRFASGCRETWVGTVVRQ